MLRSASDFPRRSSVGSIADDKENGKYSILKPAKVRSPAACSNMSPTISASIKVNDSTAPAPPSSTTPSSADPKSQIRKVTFAEPLEEKTVYALLVETVAEDSDCVNLDPTFKLSPMATPPPPPPVSSPATTVAPLDADPLMPPYDPITNYLAPRPQFRFYRPRPKLEEYDTQSEEESEDASSDEIVKEQEGEISEPSPDRRVLM